MVLFAEKEKPENSLGLYWRRGQGREEMSVSGAEIPVGCGGVSRQWVCKSAVQKTDLARGKNMGCQPGTLVYICHTGT